MNPSLFFLTFVVAIWFAVVAITPFLPKAARVILFAISSSLALIAFASALALLGVKT